MNMPVNRVAKKLTELFENKIDLSDVSEKDKENSLLSRSLALYSIMMRTDCNPDDVVQCLTDGYHDNGIDAVYCDDEQKIMYLVQSKWSKDGKSSISQGDTSVFINGISKLINDDFDGFNSKFDNLKGAISNAILSTDYKIKAIIIYTSNQKFSNECQDVMESFIDKTNDGIEIISYEIIQLGEIYESLAGMTNHTVFLKNVELYDYGVLERNEQEIGYYGKISVSTISTWWKEYGTHLFSKNIRYYKGDTEIKNGIRNIFAGFINKIVLIFLPFVTRTVIVYVLGSEYLGLGSLFSSILMVLNLSELGIGSALVYSMYKPVAEKDMLKIKALLAVYKKIYAYIGVAILAIGLCFLPFIHTIIKGDVPASMNLYILYIMYLSNASISYFIFAHKKALLIAYQRSDVISNVNTVLNICVYTVQIMVLLLLKDYYIYVAVFIFSTITENIIIGTFPLY